MLSMRLPTHRIVVFDFLAQGILLASATPALAQRVRAG